MSKDPLGFKNHIQKRPSFFCGLYALKKSEIMKAEIESFDLKYTGNSVEHRTLELANMEEYILQTQQNIYTTESRVDYYIVHIVVLVLVEFA